MRYEYAIYTRINYTVDLRYANTVFCLGGNKASTRQARLRREVRSHGSRSVPLPASRIASGACPAIACHVAPEPSHTSTRVTGMAALEEGLIALRAIVGDDTPEDTLQMLLLRAGGDVAAAANSYFDGGAATMTNGSTGGAPPSAPQVGDDVLGTLFRTLEDQGRKLAGARHGHRCGWVAGGGRCRGGLQPASTSAARPRTAPVPPLVHAAPCLSCA